MLRVDAVAEVAGAWATADAAVVAATAPFHVWTPEYLIKRRAPALSPRRTRRPRAGPFPQTDPPGPLPRTADPGPCWFCVDSRSASESVCVLSESPQPQLGAADPSLDAVRWDIYAVCTGLLPY